MNIYLKNIGIVKETSKAYLMVFNCNGLKVVQWVPKSVVELTNEYTTQSFYYTYSNFKMSGGMIQDGTVQKNWYSNACNIELKGWFYKKNLYSAC